MAWSPDQYLRFSEPRLRPALDLLARVTAAEPRTVCDLGCGAGNVTRLLVERWPRAMVTGVDDSPEMLARAAAALPSVTWVRQSLADFRPDHAVDVLFSNAALHWLPDHERLLPSLARLVAPGGVLAVQMPRNFAAPSHTLMAETAREGPWKARLEPVLRPSPVLAAADYHRLLRPFGRTLDVWETEYLQVLEGEDPVKEWTKGTWLRPLLDALEEPERSAFEAAYAARLRVAYPRLPDGTTLFPFKRIFVVLEKR
jgi:trans-aconitate 2-methyltransferase